MSNTTPATVAEGLRELADRCERASGADRELDGALDRLLYNRPKNGDYDEAENSIWRIKDSYSGLLVRGDGFARDSFCAARFTASLDDAIKLVPEGWRVSNWSQWQHELLRLRGAWLAILCRDDREMDAFSARCQHAATPALALCAASLRARAHLQEKDRG